MNRSAMAPHEACDVQFKRVRRTQGEPLTDGPDLKVFEVLRHFEHCCLFALRLVREEASPKPATALTLFEKKKTLTSLLVIKASDAEGNHFGSAVERY